ncbi:MAG: ABC transporter substrate-binding protein [Aurantimonas endophytica]|uniref:Peptide/nickel transport system substrate-binding protein n=1 Tax=Aurantimonas endophytica TaxID=1522175 RepID=A0A7W6HH88_9HYPH|nr:ABC transporter substrate-binding protein [Aurantimonas endophytica]MBB4004951.1 peptide/nickel transport system substrate-binding protein [Aurantimonas endophytica]MCO6405758.1 ABC transporter substrate-binding protein [Aurantimonas endophytica]
MKWFITLMTAALMAVAAPAMAQTPPDVLVVGQVAEPKSLDPQAVTATNDFRILVNLYDGLVRFRKGTMEVEPALATSWTISDDGLTYRFQLREDVTFHDGTAFDAAAVKFTFDRMLEADHPFHSTGPFPLAFFFSAVEEVTVVDPLTVEFVLREPFAPFLSALAYPTGLIVSPAAVAETGTEFGRRPVGTGPFRFDAWEPDAKVAISRNDDYWADAPELEAVEFKPIVDAAARTAQMLAGEIDLMVEAPAANLATFRADPGFVVHEEAGPHLWFLILNTKEGPFADKRVRQAVNYAIDKQAIVDGVLKGSASVAAGPIPRAFDWAHDETVEPYPHDPEKARALIREAGAEGATLTFYVAEGGSGMLDPVAMATAIQADLAAVGLNARIETYEWNTFLSNVNPGLEGKADMAEMAWMTNDPDTLPFLALRSDAFPDNGGFNAGYYSNAEVDRLLGEARRSTDQAVRGDLYKQIQRIVHDDAPWAFIANWKQNAVSSAGVSGFELEPSFLMILRDVSKG